MENNQKKTQLVGIEHIDGIVASIIQRHFVEQGIVGQHLAVRKMKKNYALYSVYCYQSSSPMIKDYFFLQEKLSDKPEAINFWKPAHISQDIWERALDRFSFQIELWANIKRYLLPLLGCVQDWFPYNQLLLEVKREFLEQGILTRPIRMNKDAVFYFDENEIYRKDAGKPRSKTSSQDIWRCHAIDMRFWIKASIKFQEGATLDDCIDLFLHTNLCRAPSSESVPFITRIEPAIYERNQDNRDTTTFDRIRVHVNLSHSFYDTWEDLCLNVQKHKWEITKKVIHEICKDRSFKKFGIPFGIINLSNIILASYFLEYIFEPTEIHIAEMALPALEE